MSKLSGLFTLPLAMLVLSAAFFCGCEKKEADTRAQLNIISDPSGAKVFVGSQEIGMTPLKLKVIPGTYIMKLSKLNCNPAWIKVVCSQKASKTVEVKLSPVTASIMIRSNPQGAEVYFNGQNIGETPLTIHEQPIGKYNAVLKKIGFVNAELNWEITEPRPQLISTELASNVNGVSISTDPADCNIFIDGKPKGTTPFNGQLEQGSHKISVEKAGYTPVEDNIIVKRAEGALNKTYKLQMLPGAITIKSNPPGAAVFINDQQYSNTPLTVKDLKAGQYKVRIEKENCDPVERQMNIAPGQDAEIEVTLESTTGGIDIVVNPPGVTVYLDGKKVAVSQPEDVKEEDPAKNKTTDKNMIEAKRFAPKYSKVISLRGLASGEHVLEFWHKRAKPERKTVKLTIKKGSISRPASVNMWIANSVLSLKNGNVYEGLLCNETPNEISFEPEPGVRMGYNKKDEVKSLVPLNVEE